MKDVLQTYKFNFEFNTKDSKKQLKAISDDVLKMLSDMDNASNKMKIFTNLVGYLEKVDGALDSFKTKHANDFQNMFGGLDSQLTKSLEAALGLSADKFGQLSGLRERIDNAIINKSGVSELRGIAQDMNTLFASIGEQEPINIDEWFTGKGKTFEQRIGYLNDMLADFYVSYQFITNSIKGGFGAGGASGFAALSDEVKQEAEQIKTTVKELNTVKRQLEDVNITIGKISKNSAKTPINYQVDLTVDSLDALASEYDKLSGQLGKLTKGTPEYYNKLVEMADVIVKLKGLIKEVSSNQNFKDIFQQTHSEGFNSAWDKLSNYATARSGAFIEQYLGDNVLQQIQNTIDQNVQNFTKLVPDVVGDGFAIGSAHQSKKTTSAVSQYQQLIDKLNEYKTIVEDINFDKNDTAIADKLIDIENEVRKIFNVGKDEKEAFQNLFNAYYEDDIDFAEFKNGLMSLLNIVEPVESGLSDAQTKLQEFLNIAGTLKDIDYMSAADAENSITKLEAMKSGLIELSEQGQLTTAELDKVQSAFDTTEAHLRSMDYSSYDNLEEDVSEFGDEAQESSDEAVAGLEVVETKTHGVTSAFQELINYISKSGISPKTFFESLSSGVMILDEELSGILSKLNLLDAEGNVKFNAVGSGSINSGGMISDQYALISRNKSKYLKYAIESQPKLFEAEQLGASVGTILDIFTDEVNDVMYELQKRVSGVGLNDQEHNLNSLDFLEATDEQLIKLIKDFEILKQVGLYVDHNGKNILYDKQDGFSFIDLASKSTWFTASEDNTLEENLDQFFKSIFGWQPDADGQKFMQRVYQLAEGVVGNNIMPAYLQTTQPAAVEAQQTVEHDNADVVADVKQEEVAHEQNAAAINAENQAIKEQIDLKKKAQSMTWESFAMDESLSAAKSASGMTSLADQEKFWKKSNYDKEIDFHSISEEDAENIIGKYFSLDDRNQWYEAASFGTKGQIENQILANDELRNAALNKLYYIYKKNEDPDTGRYQNIDDKQGFADFLDREITVYRGDVSPVLYGDEQKLSFSFSDFEASRFANYDENYVSATTLIPKTTIGSLATEDYEDEQEVFVQSDKLPYIYTNGQSFEEYYNKLGPKMQQAIDSRFIQLEKDRVQGLLGDNVTQRIDRVGSYNSALFKQFQQGIIPDKIDHTKSFTDEALATNSLAFAYNDLPEMQKKLVAYYATLSSVDPGQYFKSQTIGTTGLLSAIMNDPSGVQQHIAGLTGESKFNIFGQSADNVNAEADAHKNNANAIQQEEQAQKELNDVKSGYKDVSDRLYDEMNNETWHHGKFNEMANISKGMSDVYDTDAEILAKGEYVSSSTGEVFDISSLIDSINQFEQDWHMNLDYVKDYIQKVADGFKGQQFEDQIKEIDVELDDDDDFNFNDDISGAKYSVQDYENAYNAQSQEAQAAINNLAEFYQEYDAIQAKINGESIDFSISSESPTLEETQKVKDIFDALQNTIKEINDMPLVETEDDQKKLQELQVEAVGLQNTLRSAMTASNSSFSYQTAYGLSLMDAMKMKGYIDGKDVYSVAQDLDNVLYSKQADVYDQTTPDFQALLDSDESDSLGEFLRQKAKQLQLEKEITAEQQKQENIAEQTDSSDEVAEAQQQLAVEQQITAEQKEQAAIAALADDTPPPVSGGELVAAPPTPEDPNTVAAGGTPPPDGPDEVLEIEKLPEAVEQVRQAVEAKTEAFREEGRVVEQVVEQEVEALGRLESAVNNVKTAVDNKTQAFRDEATTLEQGLKKEENTEQKQESVVEQNNNVSDQPSNDVANIKREEQAHHENTDAIREEEVAQDNANNTKRTAIDILKEYLRSRHPTLSDDVLDKRANTQINRLLKQTFVDDPSNGYAGKMMLHGSKDNSNVLDPGYYLPEYKALDEVLQLIGYHLDELQPAMIDAKTQWGFSAEIVANSEKAVANMEQARQILLGMDAVDDGVVDQPQDTPKKKSKSKFTPDQKADKIIYKTALKQYRGMLNKELKNIKDFTPLDQGLNEQQQEIADLYNNTIRLIEQYSAAVQKGESVELDSIQNAITALKEKAKAYKEQNNLTDAGNQKAKSKTPYGQNVVTTISGKYNALQSKINDNVDLAGSSVLQAKFSEYEASLTKIRNLYNSLKGIDPTEGDKESFKQASAECNNLGKDVEKLIRQYEKLHDDPNKIGEQSLAEGFVNTIENRKQALLDYVQSTHGARATIGNFTDAWHGLEYTVDNGDGTFIKAKATIDNLGAAIVETAGDTQKATSGFQKFFGDIGSKFKELWVYTASRFGVDEIIQQLRTGIQYVREIDSALTELKKVTDASEESYNHFLQQMAKTGSVVGATITDLTTMAADWARLGYSMEDSAKLAESTAVLLNVSEFQDATAASEALISTMQAFQYTADESQHVVDILNEVGKLLPVDNYIG